MQSFYRQGEIVLISVIPVAPTLRIEFAEEIRMLLLCPLFTSCKAGTELAVLQRETADYMMRKSVIAVRMKMSSDQRTFAIQNLDRRFRFGPCRYRRFLSDWWGV